MGNLLRLMFPGKPKQEDYMFPSPEPTTSRVVPRQTSALFTEAAMVGPVLQLTQPAGVAYVSSPYGKPPIRPSVRWALPMNKKQHVGKYPAYSNPAAASNYGLGAPLEG